MKSAIGHIKMKLMQVFNKAVKYLKQRYSYRTRYWYAHYYKCAKIREKTVFYQAYRNNIMAGNPYAIFCELMSRPEYKDYVHIWAYRSDKSMQDDTFQKYKSMPNVIYVKAGTREYSKCMASSQFLISNSAMPSYWIKKEGQIYINTWHGAPLKTLGRDAKDRRVQSVANAQRNFFLCDYIVMPNRYTIERMKDAYGLEGMLSGQILDAGYPRTDLVLGSNGDHIRGLLEKKLGISLENKKIVLYAPTFRSTKGKSVNTSREQGEYMEALMSALPPNYELVFKVHNMMARFFRNKPQIQNRLIFDEIETNELLSITDVLITDYSSIFFDFLCRKKPILFFVYDQQEYADGRGLYFPLEELPGALCETVEDVEKEILKIQDGSYDHCKEFNRFLSEFAYHDDGKAAQRVVDIVFGQKNGMDQYIIRTDSEKERVLVIGNRTGIKENEWGCIRALKGLDCERNTVVLMAPGALSRSDVWEQISKEIKLVEPGEGFLFTFSEKLRQKVFHAEPRKPEFFARQYAKYFGSLHFSKVVDLTGARTRWKALLWPHCDEYDLIPVPRNSRQRKKLREAAGHRMTVLFIAAFDSVNYAYVNLIRELERRGHRAILLVWDKDDAGKNKMFVDNQIPFLDIAEFSAHSLKEVDFVVTTPFEYAKSKKLWKQIQRRGIFCVGFATLFSSIAMRTYTDLIFSRGISKFQEFEENGLHYTMVAAGNPQYDDLISAADGKRRLAAEEIRRILFIDQGGYPFGPEGKSLLGQVLLAMAEKHPDKQFVIKPRYLPDVEIGAVLHRPSEHLYDFIPNPPANLILLREPTILEDMLGDFDAVATMWSTAYLDAALNKMPIMLIRGLPSQEVMDVRCQRIEEAFTQLEKTGCVVDYQDVLKGKLEFRYADEAYLREEVENAGQPCTPEIVNALEDIYEQWIIAGKRPQEVFQTDIQTFREKLPSMATIGANSVIYRQRRAFLTFLNMKVQDLAFRNRAMAKPFDLSAVQKYWYFSPKRKLSKIRMKFCRLKVRLTIEALEQKYYRSPKMRTETDPIRLDYYYDWAFRRKRYKEIMNSPNPNTYPETIAFYRAMVYLRRQDYVSAAQEFASYYHHIEALDVKPLVKDRRIICDYLPKGMAAAEFFAALYEIREYDALKNLARRKQFNVYMRTYYLLQVLQDENMMEELTEVCEQFFATVKSPKEPKRPAKRETQLDYYLKCAEIRDAVCVFSAQNTEEISDKSS